MRNDFMNDRGGGFAPHIVNIGGVDDNDETETPSLCFKPKHYLSWFYGRRFKVTTSYVGGGDHGSSTTLDKDIRLANDLPRRLRPLVAFSHACEAAAPFNTFWELIENNFDLIDEFMNMTHKRYGIQCENFDTASIMLSVEELPLHCADYANESIGALAAQAVIVRNGENNDCFSADKLVLTQTAVMLQSACENKLFKLTFPEYGTTETQASESEYYRVLWSRLPWILFCRSGILFHSFNGMSRFAPAVKQGRKNNRQISAPNEFYEFVESSLADYNAALYT